MSDTTNLLIVVGIGGLVYWLTTRKQSTTPTGASNIVATSFPAPTIPTGTYNTVAIDITWTNTGTQSGSFIPGVKIGSLALDLGEGTITLAPGETHHSAKILTGVTAGSQSICPVP